MVRLIGNRRRLLTLAAIGTLSSIAIPAGSAALAQDASREPNKRVSATKSLLGAGSALPTPSAGSAVTGDTSHRWLAVVIQATLVQRGCDGVAVSGKWDEATKKGALKLLASAAPQGVPSSVDAPTPDLLRTLRKMPNRNCGAPADASKGDLATKESGIKSRSKARRPAKKKRVVKRIASSRSTTSRKTTSRKQSRRKSGPVAYQRVGRF